jgi:hypothetical protein
MIRSALAWAKNPERKARLYRVALVRRVWNEMPWACRVLTEQAERQADGDFDPTVLPQTLEYIAENVLICAQLWRDDPAQGFPHVGINWYDQNFAKIGYPKPPDADLVEPTDRVRFYKLVWLAYGVHFEWDAPADLSAKSEFDSVPLLRDIFGNPFRPVSFSPAWRTDTAVTLARQMNESRDYSAMPILADALQDAGCDNTDILAHCRDANATHVRGCWVVDLVLGKQ